MRDVSIFAVSSVIFVAIVYIFLAPAGITAHPPRLILDKGIAIPFDAPQSIGPVEAKAPAHDYYPPGE